MLGEAQREKVFCVKNKLQKSIVLSKKIMKGEKKHVCDRKEYPEVWAEQGELERRREAVRKH